MISSLIHLEKLHVFAANDRNDHALSPLHAHAIKQRVGDSAFCCIKCAAFAFCFACTHHRFAHFAHNGAHVGKVQIDEARHDHQISDRADTLLQHFIGQLERFFESGFRLCNQEQVLVRNNDQSIDMLLELFDTGFCCAHPPRTFEQERLGHNANGQYALCTGRLSNNRRSACASAAAHTSSDENHVHAVERIIDFLDSFLRSSPSNFRASACTQTTCNIRPKLDALFRQARGQCLRVGIGSDEVNAFNLRIDHIRNGVAARAANPDNRDFGAQLISRGRSNIDAHKPIPLERKNR